MEITNYELLDKVAEAPHAVVYKAYRKREPGRLLTLKLLKANKLSEHKKLQFRQKIEHLKTLNHPLIITPLSLGEKDGVSFITQDHFDGVTLDTLIKTDGGIPLKDFFAAACDLSRALEKVHDAGIVHGGIKPHNILINEKTRELRLIDFLSGVDVEDVSHFIYDRSFIRDGLAYTSPEQTGRINHRMVFSSDLYSLGIVLYEMLTGRLPFYSDDPLELIHHHLAREAAPVHELNPDIPGPLSGIVSKLLLKEPEKRYQSAKGLFEDLAFCRDEMEKSGAVRAFPLEKSVFTHRTAFISKMVGRGSEAEKILGEYEKTAKGAFRAMLISGLSGIGKTRLIQELQKPIVEHRGYFTSGKFDVYQKNIPYSSLIQALSGLTRTFLTESDERAAMWKGKILAAVGPNGKVLTDVIAELKILIGAQPEVKPLPPVESLNRFHDLFDRFLGSLASEENPLVLFIDDLQWCDVASFDFLANLFANSAGHPHLFFLGAYRHNEVDSSHPLAKLIKNIKADDRPLSEIRLGPLKPRHCHEMVSYILGSTPEQTETLSSFLTGLTEGNPLFVSESLSYLHNEALLYLDGEGVWKWDLEKIRRSDMPTTIVALFSSKIRRFSPDLTALLEYCACMGNTFLPADLALIREQSLAEVFETLKPALGQGLLVENKGNLQFVHDKVQEAVLSEMSADRRRSVHGGIGRRLFAAVPVDTDPETIGNLFPIVSHLNLAREEKPGAEQAYFLSRLNFHAGNKALNSLATQAANDYFKISRELLPADRWEEAHYALTFEIFRKAAKSELMCGNFKDSEKILAELLAHAKTDLDKAECLAEQTTSLSSIGDFNKAVETANRGLAYFAKAIPVSPEEADSRRRELMEQIASRDIDIRETILNMPFTRDRRSRIELKFYSELIPDLYMSGRVHELYLAAAQSTHHCLAGGMDESVIYSFSIMGLQLGEAEDFEQAFKYEDLARDLSAKFPNTFGATRGMNGIVWCNMHSRSRPREIIDYCLKAIQSGKNCGDLYNAGLSYGPLMWNLQVQGGSMPEIEAYAGECLQFSDRYHLSFSTGLAEAMRAGWIEPMKTGSPPTPMEEKLEKWERDNHIASAGSYYVHMGLSSYYLGEHEKAGEYLSGVRKYLAGLTDNVLKRQWHVFLALNALKLFEKKKGFETKEALLLHIRPLIEKVEKWAALGPLLKPYLAFLQAERERVLGDAREARNLYLDAIGSAAEQGYTFLEAHLNEALGELIIGSGKAGARTYFTEAGRLYRKCGAERKELRLGERYPGYFAKEEPSHAAAGPAFSASPVLPNLDIEYLMKSTAAISAEMELDELLKKIMTVVVECSGAQHGYLLAEEEGNLVICAENHAAGGGAVKRVDTSLDAARDICRSIVRYVYRTGEKIVFNDASAECLLRTSADCMGAHTRSLLCLPVTAQGRTVGIVYLENSLSMSVFTPDKTKMTELLTSQAAISIENARLVASMRKAQRELRASEERWATTLTSIGDAVIATDTSGRITFMNAVAETLTGWTLHDASLKPVKEVFRIVNEQTRSEVPDPVDKVLENGLTVSLANHTILIRRDGTEVAIDDSGAPIRDKDGKLTGVVLVFRDITERKRAEEILKRDNETFQRQVNEGARKLFSAQAELERAKRLSDIGTLAATVAHELRNPLAAIGLAAGNIKRKAKNADLGRHIRNIEKKISESDQIINNLLFYSRIRPPAYENIDLFKILEECADHAEKQDKKRISVTRRIEALKNVRIDADPLQMKEVFANLLNNAYDAVTDRKGRIEILGRHENDFIEVCVNDNGVGIDKDILGRVFDPFFSSKAKGTGLGLSVCRQILNSHEGSIDVISEPGKGSSLIVRLKKGGKKRALNGS
ncbi:MAG: AAA family ATPase [Elusimicrobiales bacterium]